MTLVYDKGGTNIVVRGSGKSGLTQAFISYWAHQMSMEWYHNSGARSVVPTNLDNELQRIFSASKFSITKHGKLRAKEHASNPVAGIRPAYGKDEVHYQPIYNKKEDSYERFSRCMKWK